MKSLEVKARMVSASIALPPYALKLVLTLNLELAILLDNESSDPSLLIRDNKHCNFRYT